MTIIGILIVINISFMIWAIQKNCREKCRKTYLEKKRQENIKIAMEKVKLKYKLAEEAKAKKKKGKGKGKKKGKKGKKGKKA